MFDCSKGSNLRGGSSILVTVACPFMKTSLLIIELEPKVVNF